MKPVEALSDILRSMHVRGSVYFCDHLEAPWSMSFEDDRSASFHLVRRGECWATSQNQCERLGPGDLVFVESGRNHVLASHAPGSGPPPPGAGTLLLCGYCTFADVIDTPLLEVLPSLAIVREEELLEHPWLKSTLDQLSAEYLSQRPGAELVVDKLTEIVLVELIRIDFGRGGRSGFVRALSDRYISHALERLHADPKKGWTLDSLASEAGLSRAALAKRFKALVGRPMFEYLTALRVQRAKPLLVETALPVAEVAERVGYESELSFVRTFKKHTGATPNRFRKQAGQASGTERSSDPASKS